MSIKQRVDPKNVFRHLQSIVPLTAQAGAGGHEILILRPKGFENWILESSPTLEATGPWTSVPGAGGDNRFPADLARRFFRLRSP